MDREWGRGNKAALKDLLVQAELTLSPLVSLKWLNSKASRVQGESGLTGFQIPCQPFW